MYTCFRCKCKLLMVLLYKIIYSVYRWVSANAMELRLSCTNLSISEKFPMLAPGYGVHTLLTIWDLMGIGPLPHTNRCHKKRYLPFIAIYNACRCSACWGSHLYNVNTSNPYCWIISVLNSLSECGNLVLFHIFLSFDRTRVVEMIPRERLWPLYPA